MCNNYKYRKSANIRFGRKGVNITFDKEGDFKQKMRIYQLPDKNDHKI